MTALYLTLSLVFLLLNVSALYIVIEKGSLWACVVLVTCFFLAAYEGAGIVMAIIKFV